MQAVVQGAFAGAGAIYLFTRAVILLGAGRAALFPALVPPFTLLIGYLTLGEVPSVSQLIGLAVVLIGFRLTPAGLEIQLIPGSEQLIHLPIPAFAE